MVEVDLSHSDAKALVVLSPSTLTQSVHLQAEFPPLIRLLPAPHLHTPEIIKLSTGLRPLSRTRGRN